MKNLKYLFAVLVLSVLVVSCAKEELSPDVENLSASDELLLNEEELLEVLGIEEQDVDLNSVQLRSSNSRSSQSTVYTLGNEASGNEVIAFNRNADGSISEAGRYSTGGTGTDGGLGNQGALALSKTGRLLYVVNPGSNEISVFYVKRDGSLRLLDKIGSGGELPVSIAVRKGLIYVLNAGGGGNITGFGFNRKGELIQLSNSTRALSSNTAGAAQISFSSNGKALIVTEKATNIISSYAVQPNGRPGDINTLPSAGVTPFGFTFGKNNLFYVSEAAGGAANASTVSSYQVDNWGNVSLVDGPFATNASAACWVTLTNNSKTLFVTNTVSNSVSSLSISGAGQISFANKGNTTPAQNSPIDAALDSKSRYLYVLATGNDTIISYSVGNNGQLTQIDQDGGLPDRATGIVVR